MEICERRMRSFRAKPVGWRGESHRHYLAAKGIKSKYYSGVSERMSKLKEEMEFQKRISGKLIKLTNSIAKSESGNVKDMRETIDEYRKRVKEGDRSVESVIDEDLQYLEDVENVHLGYFKSKHKLKQWETRELRRVRGAQDVGSQADKITQKMDEWQKYMLRSGADQELINAKSDEYIERLNAKDETVESEIDADIEQLKAAEEAGVEYYVKKVDLQRYAGTWKQESVKNVPWFQKDCKQDTVKAKYTLRDDGKVDVLNTCTTKEGKVQKAKGVARSVSKDNRRLKVSFDPFGLFEGEYNIKKLNPAYTRAVVKGGKTEWVLERS